MNKLIHNLFIGLFRNVFRILSFFLIPYLISCYFFLSVGLFEIVLMTLLSVVSSMFFAYRMILNAKRKKVTKRFWSVYKDIVYIDKVLDKSLSNDIVCFLESLPKEFLDKIKKDNLHIYIRPKSEDKRKKEKSFGYYAIGNNSITVFTMDGKIRFKTFLHELGHYIDYSFGGLSFGFGKILFKYRKNEFIKLKDKYKMPSNRKLGNDLSKELNRGLREQRLNRILFYLVPIYTENIEKDLPYGLVSKGELFSELFCESLFLDKNIEFVIPESFYNGDFVHYSDYGNTYNLVEYFYSLFTLNILVKEKI